MQQQENRKLAAILFADIVGYTAMMQSKEAHAIEVLQRFQSVIGQEVAKNKGELIKSYGDGSLLIFNSTIDAIQCAFNIQTAFRENPKVPLRIGIHLGEVIKKEGDYFGNGINIASRIESIGVAGSILFSKDVAKRIKNHPEYKVVSLGNFDFKNVEESMEVFALANEGFTIPKRENIKGKLKPSTAVKRNKWLVPSVIGALLLGIFSYWQWKPSNSLSLNNSDTKEPFSTPLSKEIRDKRVAVMVFENKTGSENLEDFGTMISDWITRGLMEIGEADVISAANIQPQIKRAGLGNVASPELEKATGVGVTVQGRYYLQEDQLIIHADIVNASDGKVIHTLDLIQGKKNQMMQLLDELTQKVLGFWAVKKDKRFTANPPKYDAWQKLNEGFELYSSDWHKSEPVFWETYQLDTTFFAPLLKLMSYYRNTSQNEKVDSIIAYIRKKNPPLTDWERNRFEAIVLRSEGNILKSAQLTEKRYLQDKSEYDACYNAGILYKRVNHLQKAIKVFNSFDARYLSPDSEISWMPAQLAESYFRLGDYDNAIRVIKEYENRYPKIFIGIAAFNLKILARQSKYQALENLLEKYQKTGIYAPSGKVDMNVIYSILCNEFLLLNKEEQLQVYTKKLQQWMMANPSEITLGNHAFLAFYQKNYEEVIELLTKESSIITDTRNPGILEALLGICYAKTENKSKAEAQIKKVLEVDYVNARFNGNNFYNKGLIETAMGKKEEAVNSLRQAIEVGAVFAFGSFDGDGLLQPLHGYPPFEEFLKPKG